MITYILIGIAFMFSLEYFINTESYKKTQSKFKSEIVDFEINNLVRIIGVLFWPVCLGVFLYNFFKEFFK